MERSQLIDYNTTINRFFTKDAIAILDASFSLSKEEKEGIKILLDEVYQPLSRLTYQERAKAGLKELKKICEDDFQHCVKGELDKVSPLHYDLFHLIFENDHRLRNLNLVHSLVRAGEFFYLTDNEMERTSQSMDSFIESGDCKLFDNTNSPYPDKELNSSLEKDLICFEQSIKNYLKEKKLPPLSASAIIDALETVKRWMKDPFLNSVPQWARGFIQVCQEISKAVAKESDKRGWSNPGCQGILSEDIMKKLSGFCLNKEMFFREFLQNTRMPSWKNPEGSWLYGESSYPWNKDYFLDMKKVVGWDMDVIYYSLGKGPWDKTRYVGQPCAFYQNVAEPLASVVKKTIQKHSELWEQGAVGVYDAECVDIYDNYEPLLDMVSTMNDSIALDFSSYSDYLSRNTFPWIMTHLWGVPQPYCREISFLMSLPIKVNGTIYPHKHGSVMGIKVNFLLITFANLLMWVVSNILSGCEDRAKAMGDDRFQVKDYPYTEEEVNIALSVTAYFNCVVNPSKTEWLKRDGFTSFCKRTFIQGGGQVSGFSGEYYLKQKPFMNDVAVWLNTAYHNQIYITQEGVDRWVQNFLPYMYLTYRKFYRENCPPFEDMITTLRKVPFLYGGWSLDGSDEAMDQIMLRSILSIINTIISEIQDEEKSSPRLLIKEYIRVNGGEMNRYYQNLLTSNSYLVDISKLQSSLECITKVLSSNLNTTKEVKKARGAAQRVMEIVLGRDSRLASSTSTKNRIRYSFDQDRVTKIRTQYLAAAVTEELTTQTSLIDNSVLRDSLRGDYAKGIKEYLHYLDLRNKYQCRLEWYTGIGSDNWIGMVVYRENSDGTHTKFYKRVLSQDSDYERIHKVNGQWRGKFVNLYDLTEGEREVYNIITRGDTGKIIQGISQELEGVMEESRRFLIQYLMDLYRQ